MIGTSLGGIVACEIANQLHLKKLTLISGAIQRNEIASFLRIISPLIDLTPLEFLKLSAGKIDSELTEMFAKSNPDFIRRMCKAIFKWDGLRADIKPFRIHGLHDHVIPIPTEIDLQIEGGHLIAMTHAKECVSVIEAIH
jgi:thioesterase domain-containing protein